MESNYNEYQLKQGNNIYIFSSCIVNDKIRFLCDNQKDKKYSKEYSIYELQFIDPIFYSIDSEENAIKFIDKALSVYKVAVTEEPGILKIIFYITNKGLINTVELPLYQLGKQTLQSKDNINNVKDSSTQSKDEANNVISNDTQQNYNNTNITVDTGEVGAYGNNSSNINNGDFNMNEFLSQNQTGSYANSGITYDNTVSTNYEGYQNYNNYQTDNNQYIQSGYDTTNNTMGAQGLNSFPEIIGNTNSNEYNINDNTYNYNIVENTPNQYISSNNIYNYDYSATNKYDTASYEISSNTYGTTQLNKPYPSRNTNAQYNEYNQYAHYTFPTVKPTPNNQNAFSSSYETISHVGPSIPPLNIPKQVQINPLESGYASNKYTTQTFEQPNTLFNEYETTADDMPKYNTNTEYQLSHREYLPESDAKNIQNRQRQSLQSHEVRINKLEGDTMELKNETKKIQDELTNITGKLEQANVPNINNLKIQADEAESLKNQIAQLSPLKQQLEEMAILKSQLLELNSLRAKMAELSSVQAQLEELKILREQVAEVDMLKKQLEELKTLKSRKSESTENLKKKIEELEKSNLEYEKEITFLKKSQSPEQVLTNSPKLAEEKKIINEEDKSEQKLEQKSEQDQEQEQEQDIECVKGVIIHDTKELEMITNKINKLNKKLTLNLLYKASADSDKAEAFHGKCDDAKSTIVLVETDKGKRFGGYTTCSWGGDCIEKKDEEAFVFSLDKMKTYDNIPGENAIGCYPKYGPVFLGCQIRIYDNAFIKGGTTFEKGLNYNTDEDFELTDGDRTFNVKEIEVYEVIQQ